jgi:IclR family transcriptional regulator, pca regulon regulatory protein
MSCTVIAGLSEVDDIVHQLLSELAARLREPCSAGVLDGRDVVFVARARTPHPRVMTLALSIGSRLPAYLSAIGRVLLAELSDEELDSLLEGLDLQPGTNRTVPDLAALRDEIHRVRGQGYSIVDQEIDAGVLAAAVPVRRANHPTIGISVALHATRGSAETLRTGYVPLLRETADEIQRVLRLRH